MNSGLSKSASPGRGRSGGVFAAVAFVGVLLAAGSAAAAGPDFLREVRPILSGHCFKCHGPDAEKRKGGLRLDVREEALKPAKSGKPALVPGRADESELWRRLESHDDDEVMPPPATKHPLTGAQKSVLKDWIVAGAEYRPHWAFVKPTAAVPPEVRLGDWPKNPLDHFILQRLEAAGIAPSEAADPFTLVRRVYLDLTGLPPTPEQADAYVKDPSPDAYEKLVDQLLASPHYGERWARRWLDLARYADTNGYEKDRPRSIWAYRDWVIRAINSGKSFRDFTIEQLAGDLLAADLPPEDPRRLDLQVATGFHRNTMLNEEGGADPQEFRFHSVVDRVHVTATTWLGLTMACAQCHTHKYDPIQHTEYYQFMAFLNNADEPWIDVPQPDLADQRTKKLAELQRLEAGLTAQFPPELRADWSTPAALQFKSEAGTEAEILNDGSILVTGPAGDQDTYTITLDSTTESVSHLQLLVLPDPSLPKNGPGRSDTGNFVLNELEVAIAPLSEPTNLAVVKLARARADGTQNDFAGSKTIDGKLDTGWAVDTGGDWHVARTLTLDLATPAGFSGGTRWVITLRQRHGKQHLLGRFRISLGRALADERPLVERRREHLDRRLNKWIAKESSRAVDWQPLTPRSARGSHPTLNIESNNVVMVSGDFTKSDTYTVGFPGDLAGVRALRVEVLADDRLPNRGPGRVNYEGPIGDFFMADLKLFQGGSAVKIKSASDSFHGGGNDAAKALDGDLQSGWSVDGGQGRDHNAVFVLEKPLENGDELRLQMIFERWYAAGLGKFRVWVTRDENPVASPHPNDVRAALVTWRTSGNAADQAGDRVRLADYYATLAPELAEERAEIRRLRRDLPKFPTTLVMVERPSDHGRVTHRHKRGEFLQPEEAVSAGVPAFLPPLPGSEPPNRLGLAKWLVSPENPMTPRVVMNREWQAFFGRGLVRTTEDFGFQGEAPTHPELLDWLAVEFVKRDWSVKQMHKLIVTSATYRQASRVTPERLAKDPENLLLGRMPRLRLEAEMVRDSALVASGLLSEKVGGPSVYPPQLASITTEGTYGPLTWTVSTGPDRYRRSLYTFAKRTAPFALFSTFDGPSGEACIARRDRSNTPLQSLTLLNDEGLLELARALGRRAADHTGSTGDKVRLVFRRCLTRPPTDEEVVRLTAYFEAQSARFSGGDLKAEELLGSKDGDRLNEHAAWTALARVLLNLDEAVTKS